MRFFKNLKLFQENINLVHTLMEKILNTLLQPEKKDKKLDFSINKGKIRKYN